MPRLPELRGQHDHRTVRPRPVRQVLELGVAMPVLPDPGVQNDEDIQAVKTPRDVC